jgi:cyclophilin family peptidyl-prolyl cis-trans isomerase
MAVIATAAELLGDSLLRRNSSVEPLLEALGGLRAPEDIETMQDIVVALGKITGKDYSGKLAVPGRSAGPDFQSLRELPAGVTAEIETSRGLIVVALDPGNAPLTTMSIVNLSRRGFYRGLTFHRVVPNFVALGGHPGGDGWGGPGYSLRSEFSPEPFGTGTVGIASAGKDTEGSQFFITHSPQPHLDGRYTVVGKVVLGMEVADRLQVGDRILDIRILP